MQRIKNVTDSSRAVSTISIGSLGFGAQVSHVRVSPYTPISSTLFIGSQNGVLKKITNADGTPTATNINSFVLPNASVSCIEIGANENELLVTFSNYGVGSVWYTNDGVT